MFKLQSFQTQTCNEYLYKLTNTLRINIYIGFVADVISYTFNEQQICDICESNEMGGEFHYLSICYCLMIKGIDTKISLILSQYP